MEEENRKLKIKLDQYRATILDERDIKNELVEKLNIIKQLVNTPLSRNRSSKAGKINCPAAVDAIPPDVGISLPR